MNWKRLITFLVFTLFLFEASNSFKLVFMLLDCDPIEFTVLEEETEENDTSKDECKINNIQSIDDFFAQGSVGLQKNIFDNYSIIHYNAAVQSLTSPPPDTQI
jgi:hypothetical protein